MPVPGAERTTLPPSGLSRRKREVPRATAKAGEARLGSALGSEESKTNQQTTARRGALRTERPVRTKTEVSFEVRVFILSESDLTV